MTDKENTDLHNSNNNNGNEHSSDQMPSEAELAVSNDQDSGKVAETAASNTHLRRLISSNYVEYASYVIKERAIPELKDGFKPVQRRILWSLYRMDDGKFHKVANIVGHSMQYHPHGDASIYHALVNLANKEYFIDKQGNFGNIFTGDDAAAARYIEARLTPLAREVLFNPDITEFTESYDGRNKEPVFLPAKIPVVLMIGQEGIAPGMTTSILPHNFKELLEAQIAVLKNKPFQLFPDFRQGGIMDVSEYNDGKGKVVIRAKIDIEGRKLIIRQIPPFTTTEKLIASIEKADAKNKIKVASISDYTAENVEIEVIPARGYNPEKALKALYTYTECSMSVSSSILVIKDNRPLLMNVTDIVKEYTELLVSYLEAELKIELDRLNERYHERTLERIFIENRIYKRIEECETYELVKTEVYTGLEPFLNLLKRDVNDKDIEKLLGIPIRRISKFDINKNREETEKILKLIEEIEKNLSQIVKYTIKYIQKLIKQYADNFPRRTVIDELEEIDKKAAALNNIKVGWDKKNCYIGENVKSEDVITCNEYDNLICIDKIGKYKIISIPQKIYVGRLYYFNKHSTSNTFSIIYKHKKTGVYYVKRSEVKQFIRDKEYDLIPDGCQLEQLTIRDNSIYECQLEGSKRKKLDSVKVDFSQVQLRNPGARGFKLTDKKIKKISFAGFSEQTEEEKTAPENQTSKPDDPDVKNSSEDKNEETLPADTTKTVDNGKSEINTQTEDNIDKKENPVSSNADTTISEKDKSEQNNKSSEKIDSVKLETKTDEKDNLVLDDTSDEPKPKKKKKTNPARSNSPEGKSEKITTKSTISSKVKTSENKDENDDEDDLGIIQPDLGF